MSQDWYFDTETGTAFQGKKEGFLNRMGPYPSEAAARDALRLAQERNEAWDEQDEDDEK